MIGDALVLAAGQGTRLRKDEADLPKPLHVVAGKTLIGRAVSNLASAGIERVVVVIGFSRDLVRAAIERDPDVTASGVRLEFVVNEDWHTSFGASLLAGRGHFTRPFVLAMADHVCEVALFENAVSADLTAADLVLMVDRRVGDVFDLPDCTKVKTDGSRIVAIGKHLTDFDAIDTGVFAIDPVFFDVLGTVYTAKPSASVSEGVQQLAAIGRAKVSDIGDLFWQDVDTPEALERAERILRR